ncbi:MAG: GMC family oxidoreductase [Geminicoccaceae bacterium]
MTPADARSLAAGTTLETDLCIVGAGAAGISLATALAGSGIAVLLVEGGDRAPDEATQALHEVDSAGYPLRPNYINRARQYGGSSNLWAGRCMALWPEDLGERSWVRDGRWPLPIAELERYLPAAGKLLDLPDTSLLAAPAWSGRLSPTERAVYAGDDLVPTVSLWGRKAMRFAGIHGPTLRRAANVRVLLNANAVGLSAADGGGRVEALDLATLDGKRLRVRARRYVLAAGGMENARLLMLSAGLALSRAHLGRYFMDHPRAVFGKVRLEPGARVPLLRGWPLRDGKVQLGMALSPELQRRERLLNHYCTFEAEVSGYTAQTYQAGVDVAKVLLRKGHAGGRLDFSRLGKDRVEGFIYQLSPKEILPHWAFRLAVAAKARLRPPKGPQRCVIVTFCEQPPDPDSRVTLGTGTDALGLPRLTVDWRIGEDVRHSLYRLHEVLGETLARQGIGRLEPGDPATLAFTDASHHLGTTRMADDAAGGVVDRDGRAFGVGNLWLAGSSVFPSGGHANPTLTIVALALRLADQLRAA